MIALLESAFFRYCLSGTLILVYMLADGWARRRRPGPKGHGASRGMHALIFASLTGYYLLIGPTGGPLAGGWGNLAGVALVALAIVSRVAAPVRHPDLGARGLFYVALPVAVGVPWGLLALSLPACAASVMACLAAERRAAVEPAADAPRYRMVPGLW